MIVDVSAFAGHWPGRPIAGELDAVRASLRSCGVNRIFVSPLDGAWSRNPHLCNAALFDAAAALDDVWPAPVLDPTITTWPAELDRAAQQDRVRLVRLLPGYSPYRLSDADALVEAAAQRGLGVIVQTRLEDPRRQHPMAQVPDVPASEIADLAGRHPQVTVIIGGPTFADVRALRDRLLTLPNLYADVSQVDGLDALKVLVADGLTERLLFGSHAPLFIPHAAIARVVTDLDDTSAAAILGGNAARLFGWAPKDPLPVREGPGPGRTNSAG